MDIVEIDTDNVDLGQINLDNFKDDIIDIDLDTELNNKESVNFGTGIELLMNDNNKETIKKNSNIELDDINNIENELNDLTKSNNLNLSDDINIDLSEKSKKESKEKTIFSSIFGNKDDNKNVENIDKIKNDLGKSTANLNIGKTSDGYSKFNNIPISNETEIKEQLSPEEILRKKFEYLKKLENLEKKGASLTQKYTMDSDLQEMMGEYEMLIAEREKSNAIKFQGKMLMACITGLEFINNKFDPFDIKLEGWSEQINENIDEYDEIFGELHEKYKSKAKMTPELRLLFQLGGSAMMVHMSNTLFKSSMPGMDEIMRQNPELMKQFSQAAVNTMGQSNPGFGNFMNNIFSGNTQQSSNMPGFGGQRENPININTGPPPPPVETKLPEKSKRVNPNLNRPDINSARGISLDLPEENINKEEQRITRPEMKGPQNDINSLLSGLKTKTIDIDNDDNEASRISVEDLKDLSNFKVPKSKRKQKSDKSTLSLNTVSLDI